MLRAAWLLLALTGCFGSSEGKIFVDHLPGGGDELGGTEQLPPFTPAPAPLRRLLGWQYRNVIADLLGPAAAAAVTAPADTAVNGFQAIGAAQLAVSSSAVDRYESSALLATDAWIASPAQRASVVGCTPAAPVDVECLGSFVERFGKRALRRPLTPAERDAWMAIGTQGAEVFNDFYEGARFVIAGLLQSPDFLYLVEVGAPDPEDPRRWKLTGYELATRLSFALTGSTPSDELLAAAERGELDTADGVRAAARRLLDQPQARVALQRFFDELLVLDELDTVQKDAATFPLFSPSLALSMREETRLFLRHLVFDEPGDFRDAVSADYTFVNAELAGLYELPVLAASGFWRAPLSVMTRRGGLLGQASFLALRAHPTSSSPTLRGKFVRERLLCEPIPAPPPSVDTNLPPPTDATTLRDRLMAHRLNPTCAGCHIPMDDVGLGLENFDGIGQFRRYESGVPIDATGKLEELHFEGTRDLGALLRQDPRFTRCLARNLFRAAVGHLETEGEAGPLRAVDQAFAASSYRLKEALVEIAASDAFRYVAPGGQP